MVLPRGFGDRSSSCLERDNEAALGGGGVLLRVGEIHRTLEVALETGTSYPGPPTRGHVIVNCLYTAERRNRGAPIVDLAQGYNRGIFCTFR